MHFTVQSIRLLLTTLDIGVIFTAQHDIVVKKDPVVPFPCCSDAVVVTFVIALAAADVRGGGVGLDVIATVGVVDIKEGWKVVSVVVGVVVGVVEGVVAGVVVELLIICLQSVDVPLPAKILFIGSFISLCGHR